MDPEGMVHALKEAHRVISPGGIMIDVRPLSTDGPLEIVYAGGSDSAGLIDMSPGADLDREADQAIDTVFAAGFYKEINIEYFDFAYYWETVEGMEEDIEQNWQGELVITEEVWAKAHQLFDMQRPDTKVRIVVRMKLGVYTKNS